MALLQGAGGHWHQPRADGRRLPLSGHARRLRGALLPAPRWLNAFRCFWGLAQRAGCMTWCMTLSLQGVPQLCMACLPGCPARQIALTAACRCGAGGAGQRAGDERFPGGAGSLQAVVLWVGCAAWWFDTMRVHVCLTWFARWRAAGCGRLQAEPRLVVDWARPLAPHLAGTSSC